MFDIKELRNKQYSKNPILCQVQKKLDKWLPAMPICMPKYTLASRLSQCLKYLLESMLASWLFPALLSLPTTPNFLQAFLQSFSVPYNHTIRSTCFLGPLSFHLCYMVPSQSSLFLSPSFSPHHHHPSPSAHGLVQSAGQVQSTTFSLSALDS